MELSDRVRLKRKQLGLTQEELAHRMGYKSRVSINKIEMGRPITQKIIVKLAEALNTSPSYLMGWVEEESNELSLKELRKNNNLTLNELSKELGISIEELKAYENGSKPIPFELLKAIAKFYNVDAKKIHVKQIVRSGKHLIASTDENYIKRVDKWQEYFGDIDFTDEEVDEILEFAQFLISKRNK